MNLDKIRNFLLQERQAIEAITITVKQNLISVVVLIGAFAMPLAPAIMAWFSVVSFVPNSWDDWGKYTTATATAIAFEAYGIYSTWVAARTYRAYRKKLSDSKELIAMLVPVGGYVALMVFTIVKSSLPDELKVIGGVLPFMAVFFYGSLSHEQDLQDREDEKRQQIIERKEAKKQGVSKSVSKVVSENVSPDHLTHKILTHLDTHPDTPKTQLAETLGISRSTLYRRLDELEKEGKLHRNGQGMKVLR